MPPMTMLVIGIATMFLTGIVLCTVMPSHTVLRAAGVAFVSVGGTALLLASSNTALDLLHLPRSPMTAMAMPTFIIGICLMVCVVTEGRTQRFAYFGGMITVGFGVGTLVGHLT